MNFSESCPAERQVKVGSWDKPGGLGKPFMVQGVRGGFTDKQGSGGGCKELDERKVVGRNDANR